MSPMNFRELDAWQVSMDLTETIYRVTERLPQSERYELSRQIRRAAVSVASNIAEGHATRLLGRQGYQLRVALGSLAELSTQLELACRFGYLSRSDWQSIDKAIARVHKVTSSLLESVAERLKRGQTSV